MSAFFSLIINVIIIPIKAFIRWRKLINPLKFTIAPKIKYKSFGIRKRNYRGTIGNGSLRINCTNITEGNINVIINNIDFSPKKKIEFFEFNFEKKGVRHMGFSCLHQEITLVKGDTLFRFPFEIECVKTFDKDDLEKHKYIPMIFKIVYSVSPKFKENTCKIEMKDFFKKLF